MMRKILMIVLAIGLVGWLGSAVWANETPTSYKVRLYKTELSADNGSTWVTVLDNSTGSQVDLVTGAGSAFGQGAVPLGTYNAIRFTIQNSILYSWGLTFTDVAFSPYAGAATAQVPIYFASSGTFSWSNNGATIGTAFPLSAKIVVSSDATSKIIMNFGVAGSLYKAPDNNWYLNPPVISVSCLKVQTGAGAPAPFAGGGYYYIRQNLMLPADSEITITPTYLALESGWGSITMTPSATDPSAGTFIVWNDTFHYRFIDNFGGVPYIGGEIYTSPDVMTGTYYVDADGYINMLIPESSGIIRGAVRNDDKIFIAIEIATPMSQTAYEEVGYHMIYAIKKEANAGGAVLGDYVFNGYDANIATAEDDLFTPRPDHNYMNYGLGIGWFHGEATLITTRETNSEIEISRPLSDSDQTVMTRTPTCWGPNTDPTPLTVNTDGTWNVTANMNMWGASLADGSISIIAGAITEPFETWTYMDGLRTITNTGNSLQFYLAVSQVASASQSLASVAGTYTFVYKGDYWDTGFGNGLPENWVSLGQMILDGAGNVSGHMVTCQRGEVVGEDFASSVKYSIIPQNVGLVTGTLGTDFIRTDVIRLYDTTDGKTMVKMFICNDGKTLVPYQDPGIPGQPATYNKDRGLGLAVKTR